jgi:glucose-1-phosphate adenylyltransferase
VRESILLTDCIVESGAVVERAILDKRVHVGQNARIGGGVHNPDIQVAIVGKKTTLPANIVVEPGAEIGTDMLPEDFENLHVKAGQSIQTNRKPYEI